MRLGLMMPNTRPTPTYLCQVSRMMGPGGGEDVVDGLLGKVDQLKVGAFCSMCFLFP
jgi:hypothetical protein